MVKNTASRAPVRPAQIPAHELVYQQLREQILFGEMAPGQAVTIQGLTASLGAGMTPVREAIRRLISEGALVFQGNRRVSVPRLRAEDAEQIIFVRKTVEKELSRRAVKNISVADINHLAAIDTALDHAISSGDIAGYLRGNYQFHSTLYAFADAPVMAEIADRLWLRFGPSLRVVCGWFGTQSLPDRHKDILTALRSGDADDVANALVQDIAQGMEKVAAVLAEDN
ncbi:GntR family transcriptional regulator [Sedimentitalea sp. XS_ASV28]|uniref:GntR family transcriptional regulator n=1 Tax=Sedimentitalea sp. XS_ASV28 TaxID=3241296 RepID=UPI0035131609